MDIVPMSEGYTVTGKTYFESEIPHESLIVIILTVEGRKTEAVFQLPYDWTWHQWFGKLVAQPLGHCSINL